MKVSEERMTGREASKQGRYQVVAVSVDKISPLNNAASVGVCK